MFPELHTDLRLLVSLTRQRNTQRQDILRIETQVYAAKARESSHHKSSPNQKHHGECNLRDNQTTAEAATARTLECATPRLFQGFRDIRPGALKRGRQTKEEGGRYYGPKSESENSLVRCAAS